MEDNKLLELLEYIDPSTLNYQEWVNVGMALKHEAIRHRIGSHGRVEIRDDIILESVSRNGTHSKGQALQSQEEQSSTWLWNMDLSLRDYMMMDEVLSSGTHRFNMTMTTNLWTRLG